MGRPRKTLVARCRFKTLGGLLLLVSPSISEWRGGDIRCVESCLQHVFVLRSTRNFGRWIITQTAERNRIMKRRLYTFSVLVAILAALTLSGPTMAAGQQVPFKGRSSGVVTAVGFDPVAGIAYTHVAGEGQATHLGHFTVSADVAVDVATGIPH
jgi:hypothetical protein